MLMLLPIVLALASDPGPRAQPPRRGPTPLQEIGRVRALPACVPIVAHANGAITQALENDRTLAILTNNLRATDFDKLNFLQRRNAIEDLMKQAEAMRIASSAGDVEIKKLREYAVNSQRSAAQGRAQGVRRRAGRRALPAEEGRGRVHARRHDHPRPRGSAEAREIMRRDNPCRASAIGSSERRRRPADRCRSRRRSTTKQMRAIGDQPGRTHPGDLADEGIAADHSIAATSGC